MEKKRTDDLKHKISKGEKLTEAEKAFISHLLDENYQDKRGRLFRAISEVSASLLSSGHWSETVDDCFRMLSETLNLRGASFCRFVAGTERTSPLIEVTDSRFDKESEPGLEKIRFEELSPKQIRNLKAALSENRSFLVGEKSEPGNLPVEMHTILAENPILILPVMVRKKVSAMVLLEKRREDGKWDLEEITSLESLTAQLSGVMEKHEMKELLESAYQQAGIGTWEMRLDTGDVYWSPVTREIMGVEPDEVITYEMAEQFFISTPDLEKVMEAIN
ncbi:MAG: GAF domain-containing protein [Balneolaceae bacterium]|nr:GAF domain-containing protein [Balneolaceae bacterium]MCH8548890.1 GAF domain-containing protein [Balneolaceae bacterium]